MVCQFERCPRLERAFVFRLEQPCKWWRHIVFLQRGDSCLVYGSLRDSPSAKQQIIRWVKQVWAVILFHQKKKSSFSPFSVWTNGKVIMKWTLLQQQMLPLWPPCHVCILSSPLCFHANGTIRLSQVFKSVSEAMHQMYKGSNIVPKSQVGFPGFVLCLCSVHVT